MNVEVTPLPGIGVRKDFVLHDGRRIGVIVTKSGRITLIVSDIHDPDSCSASIPLSAEEAATVANLLGAPQLVENLRAGQDDLPGLTTRQVTIGQGTPYDGQTLADAQIRSRSGASVVAVMRAGNVITSPPGDFVLTGGDILVVVGTSESIDTAQRIVLDG